MEETTRRIEGLGAVVVGGAVAVLPWLLDKAGVELPAWCYIAGLVIAVVAIPMGLILIFAPDTRFQSPLRRSQPSAVVLSSPDPSMALDDPPAIPPGIEFYPTRDAMNKVRGSLRAELDSVYVAWAAWYAGSHAAAEEVFEATGKPQRLILLNPQGSCTAAVANFFRRPRNQLERDVETTKDKALAAGIDTYLVDGPITPMVIGEPQSGNGWVRVEIPIPFSAVRPNVVIRQSDYPQLFHEFAQRYDEMIRHPETISFAGSGKREERRVPPKSRCTGSSNNQSGANR